jgi:hypothetical protein
LWIFSTSFKYSNQHPKCITVNKIKKLQKFHIRPVSITATKSNAVKALVLKV